MKDAKTEATEGELDEQLVRATRAWIEQTAPIGAEAAELIGWLYDYTLRCTAAFLAKEPDDQPHWQSAEDLAGDFLVSLRDRTVPVEEATHFSSELRRFLTKCRNPAGHELWDLLSSALHALGREKKKKAWRLDDPTDSTRNHNSAEWTARNDEEGRRPCDPVRWETKARGLRRYALRGADRYVAEGGAAPRIISPTQARELTLSLLEAADGSVAMRELNRLAQMCVFALREEPADPLAASGEDEHQSTSVFTIATSDPPLAPAAEARLMEDAASAGEAIWNRLPEELRELFCGYFMPCHFFRTGATLRQFGDPRRVQERVAELTNIVSEELALPEDFARSDLARQVHRQLVSTALEQIFVRHCRKSAESDTSSDTSGQK